MKEVRSDWCLLYEDIKIIFDDKCIAFTQFFEEEEPYTLDMCLDIAERNGYKYYGTLLVIAEGYLKGKIFRYGNYANDEKWYQVGTIDGFA